MGLLQGAVRLTRYRLAEAIETPDDQDLAERLRTHAFVSIENAPQESSSGWVEILNPFTSRFEPHHFRLGDMVTLALRTDSRRLAPAVLKRYLTLAEADLRASTDKGLSRDQRAELKDRVRLELLTRTPVATSVSEAVWFTQEGEVWLAGTGTKERERFEDLWRRTFGVGLVWQIPFLLASRCLPQGAGPEDLSGLKPAALYGQGRD